MYTQNIGTLPEGDGFEEAVRWQARKRIAIKITPEADLQLGHAKLGGVY